MNKYYGLALACTLVSGAAKANAQTTTCKSEITRTNVVSCALAANLSAAVERRGLESLEGKRDAAKLLLPSNPTVSLTRAVPFEPGIPARPQLWSVALSQELEVAGQRGKRVGAVEAEQKGQRLRVTLADRYAAADALFLYFDAIAAAESAKVADRIGALAAALREVALARAHVGVGSEADAQLSEAVATRITEAQIAAHQRATLAKLSLVSLLGEDPGKTNKTTIEGELTPLSIIDTAATTLVDRAVTQRADIAVMATEKDVHLARASLYERLRIPNPTLSVFVRNDWFGERTAGIGLSFPIPLPSPVGRTYAGDIAEENALAMRATTEVERLRRSVRLEVAKAIEVVDSRRRQVALYRPEQVIRTEITLRSITEEIAARRLPIRDALLTQQGLTEYLYAHVEAKRALCQASVDLARVAGALLERGAQ